MLLAQDSTVVRSFDSEKLEEYSNNKQYQYNTEDESVNKPNVFLRTLGSTLKALGNFLTTKTGVAALVILLLSGILFGFRKSIFKNKSKTVNAPSYLPNVVKKAGIDHKKLRSEIEAAEKSGDYRLAIRNLYVLVILSLADQKLIQLNQNKTNSEYRRELPKKLQPKFKRLTTIFDYVWYGEYTATAELLKQAKQYANSLNQDKDVA